MKIVVCIKQVPATEAKIKINEKGDDIERGELTYVINPYDEFGIEEALRIKERTPDTEVIIMSIGGQKTIEAIRTALAMGADRAIYLKDQVFEKPDSYNTALILASALKMIPYDIIFFGRQAIDDDIGAVGIQVAEMLGIPHVAIINKLELDITNKRAVVNRQIEGGIEVVETTLPAIFTCHKGLNEPRYASLPGIMKARQKPVQEMGCKEIGLDPNMVGINSNKLKIASLTYPAKREGGRVLDGNAGTAVTELVRLLREEAKVL